MAPKLDVRHSVRNALWWDDRKTARSQNRCYNWLFDVHVRFSRKSVVFLGLWHRIFARFTENSLTVHYFWNLRSLPVYSQKLAYQFSNLDVIVIFENIGLINKIGLNPAFFYWSKMINTCNVGYHKLVNITNVLYKFTETKILPQHFTRSFISGSASFYPFTPFKNPMLFYSSHWALSPHLVKESPTSTS